MQEARNNRVLVIDDNDAIHGDFHKILSPAVDESAALQDARAAFLGGGATASEAPEFELEDASQGQEGLEMVDRAVKAGTPYAMAFVDVRMPPGIDGIQTIKKLWDVDAELQVVICTAFADYSLDEIIDQLGSTDRLLILKKPFDPAEVRQLAAALTEKWNIARSERLRLAELEEANRALEKVTLRAEEANRTKSDFLANMSHEIRTPMTSILGNVDLLCDDDTTPEERSFYQEVIRSSGEQLLVIINDILDISKIEAGQMALCDRPFGPQALAEDVGALLRSRASEKGLSFGVEFRGVVPREVRGAPIRLRQVLVNLLGNALKFTDEGAVTLVVSSESNGDQPQLRFDVVDSGPGIASERIPSLFDPFTQIDGSSTRSAGGTGLGLAIAYRLASLMSGELQVASEPGRGSTFSMLLPISAADAQDTIEGTTGGAQVRVPEVPAVPRGADDSPASEAGAGALACRRTRAASIKLDCSVLLVEDGKLNQTLIKTILTKAGARVEVAENGALGCERFWQAEAVGDPFDLVLMDMQMPVMDGYAATRKLRERTFTGPIIALTAHAMVGDRDRCIEAGCTEYATKPIDRLTLLELCRALLLEFQTRAPFPSPRSGEVGVERP